MIRMIRDAAVVALAVNAAAVAAAPAKPAAMTAEEQVLLMQSLDRGALLYAYDQAAWHGTDDMRQKMAARIAEVGGWIVDGPPEAPHLLFLDKDEADPHALYAADFKDGKLISSRVLALSEDRGLSPARKAMASALRVARKAIADGGAKYCVDKPFNTIVLPASDRRPILVYFLTPQTKNESIPFGGHYLVEVSAEGRAGQVQRFMKTDCAELPLRDEKGKRPEALMMSDLLHSVPTEIHVFSSLTGSIPVFVLTSLNKHLWAIEGGRGRLIKMD